MAAGAAGVGLVFQRDAVDRLDHFGRTEQGVFAQVHRRGAGVGLDPFQRQVAPFLAKAADHDRNNFV